MVPAESAVRVYYDEKFDVLEIFFQPAAAAVTIKGPEDDVYFHVVPDRGEIIGMTIHRFRERNMNYMLPLEGHVRPTTAKLKEQLDRLVPA